MVPDCRSLSVSVPTPSSKSLPSWVMPDPLNGSDDACETVAVLEPVQLNPPNEYQVLSVVSSTVKVASPPVAGTEPAGMCTWKVPGAPPEPALLVIVTTGSLAVPT